MVTTLRYKARQAQFALREKLDEANFMPAPPPPKSLWSIIKAALFGKKK